MKFVEYIIHTPSFLCVFNHFNSTQFNPFKLIVVTYLIISSICKNGTKFEKRTKEIVWSIESSSSSIEFGIALERTLAYSILYYLTWYEANNWKFQFSRAWKKSTEQSETEKRENRINWWSEVVRKRSFERNGWDIQTSRFALVWPGHTNMTHVYAFKQYAIIW